MRPRFPTLVTLLCVTAGTSHADVVTISNSASDDVFLRQSAPATAQENSGTPHRNLFGGQGTTTQFVTLMRFSLADLYAAVGPGATVSSVKLDLGSGTTFGGLNSDFVGELRAYTNFDAATATWNDPDGTGGNDATAGGTFGTLLGSLTFNGTNGPYAFDSSPDATNGAAFTNYVRTQYEASGASGYVYFRLGSAASTSGLNAYLRTQPNGDGQSKLIVTTAAVPEPSVYGLLGAGTLIGIAGLRRRRVLR